MHPDFYLRLKQKTTVFYLSIFFSTCLSCAFSKNYFIAREEYERGMREIWNGKEEAVVSAKRPNGEMVFVKITGTEKLSNPPEDLMLPEHTKLMKIDNPKKGFWYGSIFFGTVFFGSLVGLSLCPDDDSSLPPLPPDCRSVSFFILLFSSMGVLITLPVPLHWDPEVEADEQKSDNDNLSLKLAPVLTNEIKGIGFSLNW